ncbi:MAG TPA: hypothetical protein PKI01_02780 [Bacteroidales bacterium]|nr:hypothetical protein [Bacteroidales bacterium]
MKKIFYRLIMFVIVSQLSLSIQAQKPTYLCELRNDVQVSGNIFEFDIYMLRTGATPFEYAAGQYGILINPLIKNGGVITVSIVAGSSDPALTAANQNPVNISFLDASSCIRIAGRIPPGAGNGALIPDLSPGMRICRVRLTNTVNFGQFLSGLTWTTTTIYPTQIYAYIGGVNTAITSSSSQTTNNLYYNNVPLPIELLSFEGDCNENGIELNWVTSSETNNDYFTIQKSKNYRDFIDIARISGAGNSNNYQYYSYNDTDGENGTTYYRLKQTDYNGHFTISKTIYTDCSDISNQSDSYSIKTTGEKEITIAFSDLPGSEIFIEAFDLNGAEIAIISNDLDVNGGLHSYKYRFVKPGVFIVKAIIGDNSYSNKIIIF